MGTRVSGKGGRLMRLLVLFTAVVVGSAQAQPPALSPPVLDQIVSRIALYPDSLLAQVLAAATFPDQIPEAARWADQHHYITGEPLAQAIAADRLPWDPSVQALLPFPSVLGMMASDPRWTSDLGNAFLSQQQAVMEAVQRMRHRAWDYGYLRSGPQVLVRNGPFIEILPARADLVVVPYYDPLVVYAPPRPGFFVGGAIRFNFGVGIGAWFAPWGWGGNRFVWNTRTVIINNRPWGRTWVNRATYVHPYEVRREGPVGRVEGHELHERNEHERDAARYG